MVGLSFSHEAAHAEALGLVHREAYGALVAEAALLSLFKILTWPIPFKGYFRKQLIAIDQLLNAATGGYPDETISSRLGRADAEGDGFADAACDILGAIEKDHCKKSIEFTTTGEPDPHHLGPRVHHSDSSTSHGQVDKCPTTGGTGRNPERGGSLSEGGA